MGFEIEDTFHRSFPGDRWAKNSNDRDIVIITDGNGFVAGMQAVVPDVKAADSQYYDYDGSPWLVKDRDFKLYFFMGSLWLLELFLGEGKRDTDYILTWALFL